MTDTFVDLFHGEPPAAVLLGAGYAGVIGCLRTGDDAAFRGEAVHAYREAGLDVLLAWRPTARRELSGRRGGGQDGELVRSMARARDYPQSCALYAAISSDVSSADLPAIDAYLRGFAATSGRPVGVLGSARVVEAALGSGAADYGWQTQAWSGAYVSARAHLYQRISPHRRKIASLAPDAYHEDIVLQRNCGAWGVHGHG